MSNSRRFRRRLNGTTVVIVGGHHDGLVGTVHRDCLRARFLIQPSRDSSGGEWWHGYAWDGNERDRAGRPIFRPRRETQQ